MMPILNVLYVALLFSVFLGLLFVPVGFLVWGVRRWSASHRLRKLPWRKRRALLGLELLWTAAFSRLTRWKMISGIVVMLSVLLVAFLFWLNAALYCDTPEAIIVHQLKSARHSWLDKNCPRPIDPERYLGVGASAGYVYTESLVVADSGLEARSRGEMKNRKCQGLFAIKDSTSSKTYIIATTGEILVLEDSGSVRLLRTE